jgi:hypothetical protein
MRGVVAALLLSAAIAALPAPDTRAQPSEVPASSIGIPPIWSKVGVAASVVAEMTTAEAVCTPRRNETMYAVLKCRDDADGIVWGHYEPSTLDLFSRFSAQRGQLAIQYDRQSITADELVAQLGVLDLQLAYARADRMNAANSAAAAQAAEQAQAAKQQADSGACSQQAQQAVAALQLPSCARCTAINIMTIVETKRSTYANCMVARGWTVSQ